MEPTHDSRKLEEQQDTNDPELLADTLKERIYATLAILAILLTIDTQHSSVLHAAAVIGGTALSLWAASFISSRMAKRMVFGRTPQGEHTARDSQRHAPLLASAALPLILVGAAGLHFFTLEQAITMSIGAILLTLILWSLAATHSADASRLTSFLLAAIVLLIGLTVVAIKAIVAH